MIRKLLVGAAGVALLTAAGAAHAADVQPIVVPPITPTIPPVAVGPTVTVDFETRLYATRYFDSSPPLRIGIDGGGYVDVKSASGWGFILSGGGGVQFVPWDGFGFGVRGEVYRAVGNAEVGLFVQPYDLNPFGAEFGPTFRYESDRLIVEHETAIDLFGGWDVEMNTIAALLASDRLTVGGRVSVGFDAMGVAANFGTFVEFDVSDRLEVFAWANLYPGGGLSVDVGGGATLTLGAFSPYIGIRTDFSGFGITAGVDFEKAIGTGPLSLVGNTHIDLDGTPRISASIGIRLQLGDTEERVDFSRYVNEI